MNPFQTLTQINLDDLTTSFGWQDRPILGRILRKIFYQPTKKFAQLMVDFDSAVDRLGLTEASRLTQKYFVRDVRVFGLDRVPDSAFLALSNHPGMTDTLSLFCTLNRPDLKIIALNRPFLNALPNVSKHLLYLKDDQASRVSLVRQVVSHLRNGGAALTFPAGKIEPDPDVYPGAKESLRSWMDSTGVFIRMAPETAVLPLLVRSVLSKGIARHPFLKIKKEKDEREKLAAALQLLSTILWNSKPVNVTVQIGRSITVKEVGTTDTQAIHSAVLREMEQLIESPPDGEGISVL